jgi:hypothetical protein
MRLRTIALAVALACGFTAAGQAKKSTIHSAAKSGKVKKASKSKNGKKFRKSTKRSHHKAPKPGHK